MKSILAGTLAVLFLFSLAISEDYHYSDSWDKHGMSLQLTTTSEVVINISLEKFSLRNIEIGDEVLKAVRIPGTYLPNDQGMPDLPGISKFLAIPAGSDPEINIIDLRMETIQDIDIAPAPRIPFETESGPLEYEKDPIVYSSDAFYPAETVKLSEIRQIRGIDVVLVGVTPFQYNPDSKELRVIRDMVIELSFNSGLSRFGKERLRSRWWDPIISDMILNKNQLPEMTYGNSTLSPTEGTRETENVEYLIITPDDPDFLAWADSIRRFRNEQGISSGIVTTTEIGGNTFSAIESYVDNAYNTWDPAPAAVLLLADYGNSGNTITSSPDKSHPYSGTYITDNDFADVDGDHLPDIIFARITARDATDLDIMVGKMLDYERNPPTNSNYYDNPVTAMGWQTERWFQLCSEIINGFWEHGLGKAPVRENAIYSGTPGTTWSTATNTEEIVDYFGPNGLGYIPETPAHLTDWGGNATRINNDINSGAFMVQHRDHGSETGWGEPAYYISDMSGLDNNDLPFIFSINCLTGEFDMSGDCFAEAFHRYPKRALGIIAASQVSYSFVNDTYTWGLYDNMWPDFMPAEETNPESRGILPAFGNAAGKYFLQQSDWPYNTGDKEITYDLFHHHGGAFSVVYSEIPQNLTVTHNDVLESGSTSFTVTADEGSLVGLSIDGELIGSAEGTGSPVDIQIEPQSPGQTMLVTVTKQNYYRYTSNVDIVESSGAYVILESYAVDDNTTGNANGQADYLESVLLDVSAKNIGSEPAIDVTGKLSTNDPYISISDSLHSYGDIDSGEIIIADDAYGFDVLDAVPDQYSAPFSITFNDTGDVSWVSNLSIIICAPLFEIGPLSIDDSQSGNGNAVCDPGETVDMVVETYNNGHADAPDAIGRMQSLTEGVTVNSTQYAFGAFSAGDTLSAVFEVVADETVPLATTAFLEYTVESGAYSAIDTFEILIGETPVYTMSEGTMTITNAIFFDSGGELENYSDRERITMTFQAEGDASGLNVKFTNFAVSSGDELHVYDGTNRNAPEIPGSPFSGSSLPPEYTSTNTDAALTFYFTSNLRTTDDGWRAEINSQVVSALGDAEQPPIAKHHGLLPNYPNPFNPSTTIRYTVGDVRAARVYGNTPQQTKVETHHHASLQTVHLTIHNVLGQKIATLVSGTKATGHYKTVWDGLDDNGRAVSSGIYLYKLNIGEFTEVRKMIYMK